MIPVMQKDAKSPLDYHALFGPQAAELLLAKDAMLASLDATITSLQQQVTQLTQRVDWFTRQVFGSKSERLVHNPQQLNLSDLFDLPQAPPPAPTRAIPAHRRTLAQRDFAEDPSGLFFDPAKVPVETIEVPNPATEGLAPDQYTRIGEKVTHRLAQRPGSYVVLRYVRPVIKRHDAEAPVCPPAPVGVIEGSRADVSFLAGLIVDKFAWHLPLHRQHQRLEQAGFKLTRPWLTQLTQKALGLLEPIHAAQLAAIRQSRVIAMDETPIKAGRAKGKMKTAYFWPMLGEEGEICFHYAASRRGNVIDEVLGPNRPSDSVLLTDGYAAYTAYSQRTGTGHALCWAHTRREFFEAQQADPEAAGYALAAIAELYAIEQHIRDQGLSGENKRLHRLGHSKPRVEALFEWIDQQFERQGLLPSNPFTKALAYARERRAGLELFLRDPDVAIDTNHLERSLRPIPMGRKNWLFCWTELGARHVGIAQSLIATCRMQGIDPYTYLVDVLQRVGQHPASRVAELTPRQWKQHFADQPLRSDAHSLPM